MLQSSRQKVKHQKDKVNKRKYQIPGNERLKLARQLGELEGSLDGH